MCTLVILSYQIFFSNGSKEFFFSKVQCSYLPFYFSEAWWNYCTSWWSLVSLNFCCMNVKGSCKLFISCYKRELFISISKPILLILFLWFLVYPSCTSMFPKCTHESFSQKLYEKFRNNKRFCKPKLSRTAFTIQHYAGEVSNLHNIAFLSVHLLEYIPFNFVLFSR